MIVLGLTGSIGMGKSTTASLFREAGAPVQDADQVVAQLYAEGGAAVAPVEAAFPGVTVGGAIDRERLSQKVLGNPEALARLESIVHPLVRAERAGFLAGARAAGAKVAVIEVQLLFEVGADKDCDATVVVTAPEDIQRDRVMVRPGMTAERLGHILARQMPDAEKRARADFVIETGHSLEAAREQVAQVMRTVTSPGYRPGNRSA